MREDRFRRVAWGVVIGIACVGCDCALGQNADKSWRSIVNPTPRDQWRPLSADRPDATESPYTVDAGAVQIELSFVELTRNREDGSSTTDYSVMPSLIKVGVTNSIDVQLVLNPYVSLDEPSADGFGDMGVRMKVNLIGNDEGDFAAALLPFMTFATGAEGVSAQRVEGGLIVPAAINLTEGISLGAQIGIEWARNAARDSYETILSHTIALGFDVTGNVGVYLEYLAQSAVDGDGRYSPSFGAGATLAMSRDAQLDAGVIFGLDNPRTDDVTFVLGMTLRF